MKFRRIFDIVEQNLLHSTKETLLAVKESGQWRVYGGVECCELTQSLAEGLISLGVAKGDKVVTISHNRPEWIFFDIAISFIGAVHVPLFPAHSETEYRYILEHCECETVVLSSRDIFEKIKPILDSIPRIRNVFSLDKIENATRWLDLVERGQKFHTEFPDELSKRKNFVEANDLFTIVYIPDLTLPAKGVMLSHKNLLENILSAKDLFPLTPQDKVLSFMPLAHILERMVNYIYIYIGVSIYYSDNYEKVLESLLEIKPSCFVAVPRVLERIYDKIILKAKDSDGIYKKCFNWAFSLAQRFEVKPNYNFSYKIQMFLADKFVFRKWREQMGGHIKAIICGGGVLPLQVSRIFWAAKIFIHEGYGHAETSPVISVNKHHFPDVKLGTGGALLPSSEIKIADDGEILFKGNSLMLGYYKNPEKTSQVIDSEGWFHTGDIGILHDKRILEVTDKKSEVFLLANGEKITPMLLENKFKKSLFIEQIMILGEGKPFIAAIICPNFEYLHAWSASHKIRYRDNQELIKNSKIFNLYKEIISELNEKNNILVAKFFLVHEKWTHESGELTPTLKLRRKFIAEKYNSQINCLFL